MNHIIKLMQEEIVRLEKVLKKIDAFLCKAPDGCLKWQNKNGKTYYYQQLERDVESKHTNKWTRKYIKKKDISLAEALAKKHYYVAIKPIIERKLRLLDDFAKEYQQDNLEEIYEELSIERKTLIAPVQLSVKDRVRQWQEEVYEKNPAYPENLRYETEQGEMVRSKSEVIIANILYQNRKHILYKYEKPLNVVYEGKEKTNYPDFTIINIQTGKITYWEHAGRMDDPYYASDFVKKMNMYMANDLMLGRDVMVTFESQGNPLDIGVVKRLVKELRV